MAGALVSRSSGLGSSPGRGHCVVFLCKALYSHSASLHPGVQTGEVEILLVASCYRNRDTFWPNEPLGSCKLNPPQFPSTNLKS